MSRDVNQDYLRERWEEFGRDVTGCYRHCCRMCGGRFFAAHPRAKYCTDCFRRKDRERFHRRKSPQPCAQCEKVFVPQRRDARYCSAACRQLAYRRRTARRGKAGAKNPKRVTDHQR